MSILGARIKLYRFENNLTQKDLAKKMGLTPAALQRVEQGTYKVTERIFLNILHFLEPATVQQLKSKDIDAYYRVKNVPKNWMPGGARNGWTNGTFGLKKYGKGFKTRRELNAWLKSQGLSTPNYDTRSKKT
jgi:DNA-binding XRE family transcriptional regulator